MEITLLSLQYFQKTAQLEHLSRAAEALHIAQPSLSKMIRSLEEALGVPLFERNGRSIALNEYGRAALGYAEKILSSLDAMQRELAGMKGEADTTVTLSLYAASKLIPDLLSAFRSEHPNVRFQILQQSETVRADLSLFSTMSPPQDGASVNLLEEEILLALPRSDPRASLAEVKLADFANDDFISLQSGKSLRGITDEYCRMAGFQPHIVLESDSPGTVREFIRAGLGVSFVPRITWSSVADHTITMVPIAWPRFRRCISLSWNPDAYLSPSAKLLRQFLIDNFASFAMKAIRTETAGT